MESLPILYVIGVTERSPPPIKKGDIKDWKQKTVSSVLMPKTCDNFFPYFIWIAIY